MKVLHICKHILNGRAVICPGWLSGYLFYIIILIFFYFIIYFSITYFFKLSGLNIYSIQIFWRLMIKARCTPSQLSASRDHVLWFNTPFPTPGSLYSSFQWEEGKQIVTSHENSLTGGRQKVGYSETSYLPLLEWLLQPFLVLTGDIFSNGT